MPTAERAPAPPRADGTGGRPLTASGAGRTVRGHVPRDGRRESADERADRRWTDLLQEVRVAQTGSQVLFGFLLSVAFMPRFTQVGGFDRWLYVVTVVLGALATGALTAPVGYHRILAGHRLKPQLVDAAARLVAVGLLLLALTIGSALLLLLRVATGSAVSGWIAGAVMLWFVFSWFLLPIRHLHRHNGNRPSEDHHDGRRPQERPRRPGRGRFGRGGGTGSGTVSGTRGGHPAS
ncbi:DUF6328 family protein [Kitasatospora sp. NPDC051170]|uniref:DUF6328 family protein n=1 Tax=Kitasatospora sp. NPDC051170 TaxID=3364056 RepID=UPI00379C0787